MSRKTKTCKTCNAVLFIFSCDKCKKTIEFKKSCSLSIRIKEKYIHKEFCSKKCLKQYLKRF
jgi:hypothetical protein